MSEKNNVTKNQFQVQSGTATEQFITELISKLEAMEFKILNKITIATDKIDRIEKQLKRLELKRSQSNSSRSDRSVSNSSRSRSRSRSPFIRLRRDYDRRDYDRRSNNSSRIQSGSSDTQSISSNNSISSDSLEFSNESVDHHSGSDAGSDANDYDSYSE